MTIRDVKRNFLVDTAAQLFLERSIASVTLRDIAERAGVGEATVYRYFQCRQNLVQEVADRLQAKVWQEYFAPISGSGYARLEAFFGAYAAIFRDHREFYRFIGEFDAYMLSEGLVTGKTYSDGVDLFRNLFLAAYREGLAERSVRSVGPDPEAFYYASAHALLSLCKSLSVERGIVPQDSATDKILEVDEMKRVILYYLAAPRADAENK